MANVSKIPNTLHPYISVPLTKFLSEYVKSYNKYSTTKLKLDDDKIEQYRKDVAEHSAIEVRREIAHKTLNGDALTKSLQQIADDERNYYDDTYKPLKVIESDVTTYYRKPWPVDYNPNRAECYQDSFIQSLEDLIKDPVDDESCSTQFDNIPLIFEAVGSKWKTAVSSVSIFHCQQVVLGRYDDLKLYICYNQYQRKIQKNNITDKQLTDKQLTEEETKQKFANIKVPFKILASNAWSEKLNHKYVVCALQKNLPNLCEYPIRILLPKINAADESYNLYDIESNTKTFRTTLLELCVIMEYVYDVDLQKLISEDANPPAVKSIKYDIFIYKDNNNTKLNALSYDILFLVPHVTSTSGGCHSSLCSKRIRGLKKITMANYVRPADIDRMREDIRNVVIEHKRLLRKTKTSKKEMK